MAGARPGLLALAAARGHTPAAPHVMRAYLAGEQALVVCARRHFVAAAVPKAHIAFTCYWKVGRAA